jgi:thioredoxin 1
MISTSDFNDFKKKLQLSAPVFIVFGADWCAACRKVEPLYKELLHKNPSLNILYVDVDKDKEVMDAYFRGMVRSVPFLAYADKKGNMLDVRMGAQPYSKIVQFIDMHTVYNVQS